LLVLFEGKSVWGYLIYLVRRLLILPLSFSVKSHPEIDDDRKSKDNNIIFKFICTKQFKEREREI